MIFKKFRSITGLILILLMTVYFGVTLPATAEQDIDMVPSPPEAWPKPVKDNKLFWFLLIDRLEYDVNEGPDTILWDAQGWIGNDYNKLWMRTEGEQKVSNDNGGEAEFQALYSRLVAPFWYIQVGGRYDKLYGSGSDPSRGFGVVGFQGLVPYRYEVIAALFVSDDGDVSTRLEAEYELLLTQRLIAQPRFETNIAVQEVEKFGVGKGFNDLELGLRLRYEIRREFAPYIGLSWTRLLGDTADIARSEGEEVSNLAFVAGVRMWF